VLKQISVFFSFDLSKATGSDVKNKIRQIIFDADDTLWENNIYYVNATADFVQLACSIGYCADEVQSNFNELEIKVVKERGYGSKNFVYILEQLYEIFGSYDGKSIPKEKFIQIINKFTKHPVSKPALFPGVIETLERLKSNYQIFVLTKGEYLEQETKIVNSGISEIVDDYFIPNEKNDSIYKNLLNEKGWNPEETCMVGNSPKSDINPALRNGMYAVYIPYSETWKLDFEPIETCGERFYEINNFVELQKLFLD
jgi:putative hydrolase of the HAD superfamily